MSLNIFTPKKVWNLSWAFGPENFPGGQLHCPVGSGYTFTPEGLPEQCIWSRITASEIPPLPPGILSSTGKGATLRGIDLPVIGTWEYSSTRSVVRVSREICLGGVYQMRPGTTPTSGPTPLLQEGGPMQGETQWHWLPPPSLYDDPFWGLLGSVIRVSGRSTGPPTDVQLPWRHLNPKSCHRSNPAPPASAGGLRDLGIELWKELVWIRRNIAMEGP